MKKKVISLMLVSAMVLGTLSGCGRGSKDDGNSSDTDKMTKKYEKYFDEVDDNIGEDIKYIKLDYSLSGDNILSDDDTEDVTKSLTETMILPIVSDEKNASMTFNSTTDDVTSSMTFATLDKNIYVATNSGDTSYAYKMNQDDYNSAAEESSSSGSLTDTDTNTYDSLSSVLSAYQLYDTSNAYVYKESKEDGDKTYDVITTDNGRTKVTVSNDDTEDTEESNAVISTIYTCYINTDTKLPEKFVTDITQGDKTRTVTCDVEYLKEFTLDNVDTYSETDYDTFSPVLTQTMMATVFGSMYFMPETYTAANNATSSSSSDINTEEGTESIDEDFTYDDGSYVTETLDDSETDDTVTE